MSTFGDETTYWLRYSFGQELLFAFFGVAATVVCLVLMWRMAKTALGTVT